MMRNEHLCAVGAALLLLGSAREPMIAQVPANDVERPNPAGYAEVAAFVDLLGKKGYRPRQAIVPIEARAVPDQGGAVLNLSIYLQSGLEYVLLLPQLTSLEVSLVDLDGNPVALEGREPDSDLPPSIRVRPERSTHYEITIKAPRLKRGATLWFGYGYR